MDRHVIQLAKVISEKVIRSAGILAKDKFDNFAQLTTKDEYGDVVTEVDHLTERIILPEIRLNFPTHRIHSEEAGDLGPESDWLWLIDPLDGTNNYAIGLPVFTTSITLMYKREPVLGVVYEPMTDRLFVSAVGEGAYCNNKPMQVRRNPDLWKGNIGWIQGHKVQNNKQAVQLRRHIDANFKRMMRLWAPTLQWCMLAKGNIDGIILFNSEGDDLYSGVLMVKEAGGVVVDFDGKPFIGMCDEPYLIACHKEHQDDILRVVREGLGDWRNEEREAQNDVAASP
ncbi:myo-inositol-1(or 4)-monophosphatase [Paenibacillus sp. UNCCL117]|uniref:inositol monophosphatase family protein n=1 Tax=unclassified Paenibacillus TaxID=185978 RepID=UPI000884CCF1|nr:MULTISPECIES: inositol monophosphatase [unclassified Paenibacillus]SDE44135.1 myo-inositol-1(or 4)-monophosphatase [Paenibacillus sp. cl123]SFW46177.1 myo-inositol-1(or 4)-monophosphatase [Paenibacillus sp. UNCCL117]